MGFFQPVLTKYYIMFHNGLQDKRIDNENYQEQFLGCFDIR